MNDDSDDGVVILRRETHFTSQSESTLTTEMQPSRSFSSGNLLVVSSQRESRIPSSSSPAPSNVKNQIFVKIVMTKDDGTHLKTKGMPFARFIFFFV